MFARLEAPSLGDDLRIESFRGTESLCRPYAFDIQLTVVGDAGNVDLAEAVGSQATLRLARDHEPQCFHGVLAGLRLMVQTAEWALYQATLVPRLWYLGNTRHSRVFTKMTIPDIIKEVLESSGLGPDDFELRLVGDYEEEELVVQYQESRLDFIHRWMEHEGIYYFFEQGDSGAKMVIVDALSAHEKMVDKTVRYRPTHSADVSAGECFDSFTVHYNTTVKSVRLADYDYARPALDIAARRDVSSRGVGEMSVHGARFFDPGQAERYAKIRAEELAAREIVQHASGTALHLGAGYLVELTEHPNGNLNTSYLITEVVHFCNQIGDDRAETIGLHLHPPFEDVYRVQITTLDAATQYRPPAATPWPRVWGMENGSVDGPADSSHAQIDDQGRYLVKFRFDESDLDSGRASTYVRMMQPHGGTTEGFHFPLRKGTEVIFSFLGGDPDRPVIAGVVPNMVTPSPVTEKNHTQNVIRTGANNHLILDDATGAEFISMRTPKLNSGIYFGNPMGASMETFDGEGERTWGRCDDGSVYMFTDGSTSFNFGGTWWVWCREIDEWAAGPVTEMYQGHHKTTVSTGGRKEEVTGLMDEDYKSSHKVNVTGTRQDDVSAKVTETFGEQETTVKGFRKITAQASELHDVTGWLTVEASAGVHLGAPAIHAFATSDAVIDGGPSLTLKAANILIDGTSKVTIKTPDQENVDPNKTIMGTIWKGLISSKFEYTTLSLAFTSIKIEGAGLKLENGGAYLKTIGPQLKALPAAIKTEGLKAATGGILSELRGIISLG